MTVVDSGEKIIVRKTAVKYLHSEIHNRYELDHLKSISRIVDTGLLEGITQQHIDRLQSLFTTVIYPEVEHRMERDRSFESLLRMLKNPQRLTFMIPSLPGIMLRYATIFPTALRVGLNTVMAYTLSNRLEDRMVENLMLIFLQRGEKITPDMKITPDTYLEAYRAVPYNDGKRIIALSSTVMKAGKRKVITTATWDILNDVQSALIQKDKNLVKNGRPPVHKDDILAIGFGKSVLEKIRETFDYYPDETMGRMIQISFLTEMDYLNRMYGK